jgi:transposase
VLGYRGGYTAVTDLLREIRPVVPPPFELRFETPPGQQAQRLHSNSRRNT